MRWIVRSLVPLALSATLAAPLLARDLVKTSATTTQPALAPAIVGRPHVIDGDTIDIAGTRIRLEGIDAPEAGQRCKRSGDSWLGRVPVGLAATWDCGGAATKALSRMVGDRDVTCQPHGVDKYGRTLAICAVAALDINAEMVRQGHAWAFVRYSQRYVAAETEARIAKRGVWQAPNTPPWEHRAASWQTAEPAAPGGCAIKGNITRNGHIYHMPWSPWYAKTSIDEARGERWFCSETEAVAAGWRAASAR